MEEINVGEYVRTNFGICKVTDCVFDADGVPLWYLDKPFFLREDIVIKHSFNIIDLIEVGDYVNGKYVFDVFEKCGKKYLRIDCLFSFYSEVEIVDVVTYEQFNTIKYEVK